MRVKLEKIGAQLVDELYGYEYLYRIEDPSTKLARAFIDRTDMPNGEYDMPDSLFDFNSPMELEREVW